MTSSIEVKRPPYPNFENFTVSSKTWLTVMEYMCHTWTRICSVCRNHNSIFSPCMTYRCHAWTRICSVCRNHNSIFSPCMTYRRVCNKSKRLLEQKLPTFPVQISSSSVLSGVFVVKSLVFYVLQIIVCAFVFFRLMASDYPLGILDSVLIPDVVLLHSGSFKCLILIIVCLRLSL